jgi:hypothetical protein
MAAREAFNKAVDVAAERVEAVLPESLKAHSSTVVLVAGGSVALLTLRAVQRKFYKSNPFNFGRTGALKPDEINASIVNYEKFFDQQHGQGIQAGQVAGKAKSNTPEFVDKFYRRAAARGGVASACQRGAREQTAQGLCFSHAGAGRLRWRRRACSRLCDRAPAPHSRGLRGGARGPGGRRRVRSRTVAAAPGR